jgi:hypothetical protein
MVQGTVDTGRSTFIRRRFSNEGLGGGGQRAQRGGSMAGTVGRAISQHFSQETGMGHLEQQTDRGREGNHYAHTDTALW